MHYYQFNIGDYMSHAGRLSLLEDLAYRRMIDMYFLNEKPFDADVKKIARMIGMGDHLEEVKNVLDDFFTLEDGEYRQKRIDTDIAAYQEKSEKAKAAGRKGGKAKADAKQDESERIADAKQTLSDSEANHKPITNNHKPLTNNQIHTSTDVKSVFDHWCFVMKKRGAIFTDKRKNCIQARIREGYTLEDLKSAINGCASSAYHMGQNDGGKVYDDLTLIFRSGDKVEQFKQYLTPVKQTNGGAEHGRKLSLAERAELETAKVLAMCEAEEAGYSSVAAYESALREQVGDGAGGCFSGGAIHGELLTLVSENGEIDR